jgi:hypothetical protein
MAMIYPMKQKKLRQIIACLNNSGKSLDYYFLRKDTACFGKGNFKSEKRKIIALN